MKHALSATALTTALTLGWLTGCDKPRTIQESREVTAYTIALITRMNEVFDTTEDGRWVKKALEMLKAPASCMISTEIGEGGMSSSKIFCQSLPIPESPKGRIAIVWPVVFPTTLLPGSHLSTVGVHLEDGVFDADSGCSIYEIESSRRVIGSSDPVCRDINERAGKIIDDFEKMIDEWLRGDGRTI